MSNKNNSQSDPAVTYGTPTLADWKIFLLKENQNPTRPRLASDESSSESSFELEESFKALLERKRREMEATAREAHLPEEELDVPCRAATEGDVRLSGNDSTYIEQDSISKLSDTSFEEMERICAVLDKVHGIGESAKTVTIEKEADETTEKQPLESVTLGDITQLEDIDEPTGLWENTMHAGGDAGILSPVKRMHLLRPSTILEESSVVEPGVSKDSSLETFVSAKQSAGQETTNSLISNSGVYRTAEETFATDSYARSSILDMDSGLTSDLTAVDNQTCVDQDEDSTYSKNSTREAMPANVDENVIILESSESEGEDENENASETNREQMKNDIQYRLDSMLDEQQDESLLDHEDDEHEEMVSNYNYTTDMSILDEMPDRFNDTMEETDFMLKQGMRLMALKKQQEEEQKRNQDKEQFSLERRDHHDMSTTAKSRTNSDSEDPSRLIMHTGSDKGSKNATPVRAQFSYLTPTNAMRSKLNVQHETHSGGHRQALFSSAGKNSATKAIANGGGAASAGSFKKPISRLPHLKVPARKFDHIVSPIGAYIKKTPQNVLQTKISCNNKNLIDLLHSEGRDSGSLLGGGNSKENYAKVGGAVNLKGYTSSLPRKGVISSNSAHVLDERNVVRIPGGEKMQKLINNSPTLVIRHEGRIKYATKESTENMRQLMGRGTLTDDSLADLSVLSNDVSVRVLKDAKQFH
ncbi:uncharacterized protein LOC128722909 [Anopheles nili]|uniref:uncharacterized protein LOC128722909 n=1 Tax=Anopheles nili TaxID=185578 RepID=UPI00237A9B1B|nr:uncharacterized protein LOC128722909 [Anopheles nili]